MALDSVITSPHRRSQPAQNAFTPPSFNRQLSRNELGNSMTLLQRRSESIVSYAASKGSFGKGEIEILVARTVVVEENSSVRLT